MIWPFKSKLKPAEAEQIAQVVVDQTNELLSQIHLDLGNRMQELKAQVQDISSQLHGLERRFENKEMRDRTEYGQIQYKLNEVKKS